MSYILEALRRAETERERKRRVPGLHAQPVPVAAVDEPRARRSKAWLWVALGLSAGVLLPLAWQGWGGDPPVDDTVNARASVAGSVTAHSEMAAADASTVASSAPAAAPPTAAAPAPAAAQERPRAPPATTTAPRATATPRRDAGSAGEPGAASRDANTTTATAGSVIGGATPGRSTKPAPATAPAPAPASAPEPRLRTLAELPDELRRSVPQLAFGGSVYSEIAAQRMVILNGQVLREGDAVTEELHVEQIRPRSAVMRLRGQRFEIVF